jgi:hypothetical protein
MVAMLEIMAEAAPTPAGRLGAELTARLDLDAEVRAQLARIVAPTRAPLRRPARPTRPAQVNVLVDAAARLVVIVTRKIPHARRWRRWAVLIDGTGVIDDCLHEDDAADGDAADLVAGLLGDGYPVASTDVERARQVVATAARRSADGAAAATRLTSAYYLGRDLLELGDAHLGSRPRPHPTSTTLGRAVDLLASGYPDRARALLARCAPADADGADAAAALAACLIAEGQPAAALPHLVRAATAEPSWPLHHWNLAATAHQLGQLASCHDALRRFVATSAMPGALRSDPAQAGRVATAERLIAALELQARRDGIALATPTRRAAHVRRRRRTRAPIASEPPSA